MRGIEAVFLVVCVGVLGGCAPVQMPLQAAPQPASAERRVEAVDALGQLLFQRLRRPDATSLLADGATLDALYESAARGRLLAEQAASRTHLAGAPWGAVWADHQYAGVCVQLGVAQGRGLRAPAWVVDRVLVVARRGDWRSASWVSGTFVLTSHGFQAIAVSAVEPPRPGHADLELAPCDVQRGL